MRNRYRTKYIAQFGMDCKHWPAKTDCPGDMISGTIVLQYGDRHNMARDTTNSVPFMEFMGQCGGLSQQTKFTDSDADSLRVVSRSCRDSQL